MQANSSQNGLFSPIEIRNLTLKNRIVASAMCQYSAIRGAPTNWHLDHHALFAVGGVALGFTEATAVEERGRITHACTGIWDDCHIEPFRQIAEIYHRNGALAGMQLAHAGRKASCTIRSGGGEYLTETSGPEPKWETIAPSSIAFGKNEAFPKELTQPEIQEVVAAWAEAARRTEEAGFDVLEIHGAHGYLINQFLSPITNGRKDKYGGSLANRIRFALEVVDAVRSNWPSEKPLFFRLSSIDGVADGWTIEESVQLANLLGEHGVDVVDCSAGGILHWIDTQLLTVGEGYQVPYAERIRSEAQIATMAVGLILSASHADQIIRTGQADLIALARTILFDPFWTLHAAQELGADPDFGMWPKQYRGSLSSWYRRSFLESLQNEKQR